MENCFKKFFDDFVTYDHEKVVRLRDMFMRGQEITDPAIPDDVIHSWKRSKSFGLNPHVHMASVPSENDKNNALSHISSYTRLLRSTFSTFYNNEFTILEDNAICLCYVGSNLDILGRYGNRRLKDTLKDAHIEFGMSLTEERMGTNAACLAAELWRPVCLYGAQHFLSLWDSYVSIAIPMYNHKGKIFHLLYIQERNNFSSAVSNILSMLSTCENIVSGGHADLDLILKGRIVDERFTINSNALLLVNYDGVIIYANDMIKNIFRNISLLNTNLKESIPELKFLLDCFRTGSRITGQEIAITIADEKKKFILECIPEKDNKKWIGLTIILTYLDRKRPPPQHQPAIFTFDDLAGKSPQFLKSKEIAQKIASRECSILLTGESGSGKELFAHAIHNQSPRNAAPFISMNCAAIPRELFNSELFGYMPGAFTGASRFGYQGKFEQADGGTLFLDEIGDMPLDIQASLLRCLEEKTISRIGGKKPIAVDIRIIAATNKNLRAKIKEGTFRADLYYRLNIIRIELPPLRSRGEDILLLAEDYLHKFSIRYVLPECHLDGDAQKAMLDYHWPGNIRELRNAMERCVLLAEGGVIHRADLPPEILENRAENDAAAQMPTRPAHSREEVEELMLRFKGNKSRVAQSLGVARSTLYRLLRRGDQID